MGIYVGSVYTKILYFRGIKSEFCEGNVYVEVLFESMIGLHTINHDDYDVDTRTAFVCEYIRSCMYTIDSI